MCPWGTKPMLMPPTRRGSQCPQPGPPANAALPEGRVTRRAGQGYGRPGPGCVLGAPGLDNLSLFWKAKVSAKALGSAPGTRNLFPLSAPPPVGLGNSPASVFLPVKGAWQS